MLFPQKFYPTLYPDSASYMAFDSTRSAIYPVFLDVVSMLGLGTKSILLVQSFLFLGSFAFFLQAVLALEYGRWAALLTGIGIGANVFLVKYTQTILTEGLVFTLIFCALGLLIKISKRPTSLSAWLALGVIVGLAYGVRPALLAFVPATIVAMPLILRVFSWAWLKSLMAFLIGVAAMIAVEAALFHKTHEARGSLFSVVAFGKAGVLISDPNYRDTFDGGPNDILEEKLKSELVEVRAWRMQEKNWLVRTASFEILEVRLQYSLFRDDIVQLSELKGSSAQQVMEEFGRKVILNNPIGTLKLGMHHYLGLWNYWTPRTSEAFAMFGRSVQFNEPAIMRRGKYEFSLSSFLSIIEIIQFAVFIMLGVICFVLTFWGAVELIKAVVSRKIVKNSSVFVWISVLALAQAHLVLVAMVNMSGVRYFLVSFPMLTFSVVIVFVHLIGSVRRMLYR